MLASANIALLAKANVTHSQIRNLLPYLLRLAIGADFFIRGKCFPMIYALFDGKIVE